MKEYSLKIYDPEWGSELANTIIELEKLRVKRLSGPVPSHVFFQLKEIFQMLESLGSMRIEGNRTTLAEYVEKKIGGASSIKKDERFIEVSNGEKAIDFIEEHVKENTIFDRAFISEIHKMLINGLTPPPEGEGSRYPGELRRINVAINGSIHHPPDSIKVADYLDELLSFINEPVASQYHLLVTAIAHHRMAWIHPFDNGNGRIVRMLTYALLIKQGFQVKSGRILNPTAIFCVDREEYYKMLSVADLGTKDEILSWCSYVLSGLLREIEKIDKLLDLKYMTEDIFNPVLKDAEERRYITPDESAILKKIVSNPDMLVRSGELESVIGEESPVQRSRILKRLKEKGMIAPLKEKGRIYTISFSNNFLLRSLILVLQEKGFIPQSLNDMRG